ncbi:MAG: hypothetical protein Q9174_005417 [Haloplaca sp. 1 TL-2023]
MFSSLGLFKQTPCPEYPDCQFNDCLFSHDFAPPAKEKNYTQINNSEEPIIQIEADTDIVDGPRKRRRLDANGRSSTGHDDGNENASPVAIPSATEQIKPKADRTLPRTATKSISPPPLRAARTPAVKDVPRAVEEVTKPSKEHIKTNGKAATSSLERNSSTKVQVREETLNPRMLPNPPVPHPVRMKLLAMLHGEMARLNKQLKESQGGAKERVHLSNTELITEALNEELEMAKKNQNVYQNVIKSRIMVLKRMKLDIWKAERLQKLAEKASVDGPKQPRAPKVIQTGLTATEEIALVPQLAAQQGGLDKHGYITTAPTESEIEAARQGLESSQGWEQCDRCTTRFRVFPGRRAEDGALTSGGTCTYHWAKPRRPPTAKGEKPRDLVFACCDQTLGTSTGCTKADSHVFKTSDPKRLALVMPFMHTPVSERPNTPGAVCFDCEMGYSTMGMELIRLTATAWPNGLEVLDVLVRPQGEVLDLNSRFSGVWPVDYAKAIPYSDPAPESSDEEARLRIVESPAKARELLFELLTPATPLIGHALENDLNAARILHPVIVDTALLYPHPRGLPLRFGLKMLMKKHLDRDIQMGGALGHDSKEDARAAGDLVRYRLGETWQRMKGQGWWIKGDGEFCPPLPP